MHETTDAGTSDSAVPTSSAALEELDQELTSLMTLHRRWFRRAYDHEQALGASTYAFLCVIHDKGPIRPGDEALALDFNRSAVSQYAIRLKQKNLITSTPDPRDRRARLLSVTPLGVRKVSEVRSAYTAFLKHAFNSWTTTDIERILQLLTWMNTPPHDKTQAASPAQPDALQ